MSGNTTSDFNVYECVFTDTYCYLFFVYLTTLNKELLNEKYIPICDDNILCDKVASGSKNIRHLCFSCCTVLKRHIKLFVNILWDKKGLT